MRSRGRPSPSTAPVPILEVHGDQPSTISTSGNNVTAWGPFAASGTPELITDTVTGQKAIRFDAGNTLALPAGAADYLSSQSSTVIIVWRQRLYSATADSVILDSSANGASRGYQLITRDKRGSGEYRQILARVSNGSSWPVDHTTASDPSGAYIPLKWNVTAATVTPQRATIAVDHSTSYDDAFSVTLPAGAAGALTMGGSQIDVMHLEVYSPALSDSQRDSAVTRLAKRAQVDTVTTIAGDGYTARHYGFPAMAKMANGNLLAVYRNGIGHGDDNGHLETCISTDGGDTWSAPTTVYTAAAGSGLTPFDPNIVVLANNDVLINFFAWDGLHLYFIRSSDNGVTWTAPQRVTHGYTLLEQASAPILQKGSKLLWPVYVQNIGDAFASARVYISTDGGATWPTDVLIANGVADSRAYNEPGIITLQSGNLFCLIRDNTGHSMFESQSADDGATWSAVLATNLSAYSAARLLQWASGKISWLGRPANLLVATIFDRISAGVWTTQSTTTPALGLDATPGTMVYGTMLELAAGVASVVFSPQLGNNPNVYAEVLFRRIQEWLLDGQMPSTITPVSATVPRNTTKQFTAAGAGNFTWSLAASAGGDSVSASGLYTAGNVAGSATVRATDLNGYFKDAAVTVT